LNDLDRAIANLGRKKQGDVIQAIEAERHWFQDVYKGRAEEVAAGLLRFSKMNDEWVVSNTDKLQRAFGRAFKTVADLAGHVMHKFARLCCEGHSPEHGGWSFYSRAKKFAEQLEEDGRATWQDLFDTFLQKYFDGYIRFLAALLWPALDDDDRGIAAHDIFKSRSFWMLRIFDVVVEDIKILLLDKEFTMTFPRKSKGIDSSQPSKTLRYLPMASYEVLDDFRDY